MKLLIDIQEQVNGSISKELMRFIKPMDFNESHLITDEDELVIYFSGGGAIKKILNSIKQIKSDVKIAWYLCDMRNAFDFPIESRKVFDFIFNPYFNSLDGLKPLTKDGKVFFIPQAGFAYDTNQSIIKEDLIFIGNLIHSKYHSNRRAIINSINSRYKIKIISGEKFHNPNQTTLYQNTKISLNISPPNSGGASNRLYNILAAGGVVLTNYFDNIEKLFINNEDLVWFKSESEMISQIKDLIENQKLRETLKENALNKYNLYYNGGNILNNMENIMKGNITQFNGIIV